MLFSWIARLTLLALCIVASVWDLKWRKIPNWLVVTGLILGLLFRFLFAENVFAALVDSAFGLLAGGLPWLLADVFGYWLTKRRSIGGGDMKFYAMCGVFLGFEGVLLSYCVLAVVSVCVLGLLWLCRKVKRKDKIPLAPLIAAAVVITEVIRL